MSAVVTSVKRHVHGRARAVPAAPHRRRGDRLGVGEGQRVAVLDLAGRAAGLVGGHDAGGAGLGRVDREGVGRARAGVAGGVGLGGLRGVGADGERRGGRRPRGARAVGDARLHGRPGGGRFRCRCFTVIGALSPVGLPAAPLRVGVVSLVDEPSAGAVRVTAGRPSRLTVVNALAAVHGARRERGLRALHRKGGRQDGGEQCEDPDHAACVVRGSGVVSRQSPAMAARAMSSAGTPMTIIRTLRSLSVAMP